jgi:hypothetical protein
MTRTTNARVAGFTFLIYVAAGISSTALLPIPVLVPIVVMLYWLWRVRIRKTFLASLASAHLRSVGQ